MDKEEEIDMDDLGGTMDQEFAAAIAAEIGEDNSSSSNPEEEVQDLVKTKLPTGSGDSKWVFDEAGEEGNMYALDFRTTASVSEVDKIYQKQILGTTQEEEKQFRMVQLNQTRLMNTAKDMCDMRDTLYFLARNNQILESEDRRLRDGIVRTMNSVQRKEEAVETLLCRLDQQQRELNESERYQADQEKQRLQKLAEEKVAIAAKKASMNRLPGMKKSRKKKGIRNRHIMTAVGLKVEYDDETYTFRVPWSYTFGQLLEDCVSLWRVNPANAVLEDGYDNVWPKDAVVTNSVEPTVGEVDEFEVVPRIVLIDKSVALSMFSTETLEEKRAKAAAAMVSKDFIGPLVEGLAAKSIRLRTDLAKDLGPYLIFLLVFISCLLLKRNIFNSFVWTDALKEYFMGESFPSEFKPNVNFAFRDIANSEEMYQWMHSVFYEGIFGGPNGNILIYTKLIGGLQIRTIKVKQDSCTDVFPQDYQDGLQSSDCYSAWTGDSNDEDRMPYSEFKYRTDIAGNGTLPYRYYWRKNNANAISLTSSQTRISYPPDGYYTDLPPDPDVVQKAITDFENGGFVEQGTRAVIITMLLFNPNYNIFNYVNFLFEFDQGGLVLPSMYQKTFRMDTYGESDWPIRFAFDMVYVVLIMRIYYKMTQNMQLVYLKTSSYTAYFQSSYTVFDLMIAVISTVYIILEAGNALNETKINFDITTKDYVEVGSVAAAYELGSQLVAFCAFFVVMRTFEYLSIIQSVEHLCRTIGIALPECISFSMVFGVMFYALVIMAHVVFGYASAHYNSVVESTITLAIMLLGEFDYEDLVNAEGTFAPLFFMFFNVLVVFVLLNVFIGIIADAFEAAKHIDNDPTKDYLPSAGSFADDVKILCRGTAVGLRECIPSRKKKISAKEAAEEEADNDAAGAAEKDAQVLKETLDASKAAASAKEKARQNMTGMFTNARS